MKKWCWVSVAAALTVLASNCGAPYQQTYVRASARSPGGSVGISYFYDDLSPYGRWIDYPSYGWCWTPYDVWPGWRPYTDGSWAYTEFGWTWVSPEPWGWATYHYGRWHFDPDYGWLWVPGTEWGPAWVAWHYSDDWVGWAPLPPAAGWDASVGLRFGDVERIPANQWCFVERRHLLDRNVRGQLVSVVRNTTLMERTRDATRFESRDGKPVNRGLELGEVERWAGRRVPREHVVDVPSPDRSRGQRIGVGTIGFFRPSVRDADLRKAPPPEVQQAEVATPDLELGRQQESDRRALERSLAAEQARLDREHANELRLPPPGETMDLIRSRHAAEKQAFSQHAAEQRQLLEQRYQKRIARPARAKDVDRPRERGRGKDKDRDKDKEKGEHGGG